MGGGGINTLLTVSIYLIPRDLPNCIYLPIYRSNSSPRPLTAHRFERTRKNAATKPVPATTSAPCTIMMDQRIIHNCNV